MGKKNVPILCQISEVSGIGGKLAGEPDKGKSETHSNFKQEERAVSYSNSRYFPFFHFFNALDELDSFQMGLCHLLAGKI